MTLITFDVPIHITHTHAIHGAHTLPQPLPGTLYNNDSPLPQNLRRLKKRMSPAALLNALCLTQLHAKTHIDPDAGFFLGVGPSGGDITQLHDMLCQSTVQNTFNTQRFGTDGLRACNPLFAFQLMNNFTMCHGAILHNITGPNATFFSRGQGTIHALIEAAFALSEKQCKQALFGGADCAIHPVTHAELLRQNFSHPTNQAAALLCLQLNAKHPLAAIHSVSILQHIDQLILTNKPFESDAFLIVGDGDFLQKYGDRKHPGVLNFGSKKRPGVLVSPSNFYEKTMIQQPNVLPITILDYKTLPYTLAAHPALAITIGAQLVQHYPRLTIMTQGTDQNPVLIHMASV